MNDGFYANALLSKHPAYKNEQEYRLLVSGARNETLKCDRHRWRARGGDRVGYLTLPIPNWGRAGALTHVRLGPAASSDPTEQLRAEAMSLGIHIPPIDRSNIPYRSVR